MGNSLHTNWLALLWAYYCAESMPDVPVAWAAVERGLNDPDAAVRELAIAVAATGPFRAWRMIDAHVLYEPEQWLRRFCAHVLTERHEELAAHAAQHSRR